MPKSKTKQPKTYNIKADEDLEKIEEDIMKAADKAGKKNVIVNIFSYPHKKLKKRWNVRYKFNKKHLIYDLIILGVILFLIGLNIFWLYGGFNYFTNKLDIQITTNQQVYTSGVNTIFTLSYENKNKFELEEVVMSLKLPDYFEPELVSNDNYNFQNNSILLGDLPAGSNGQFKISGRLFGNIDSQQSLIATFTFYKTNKEGQRLWGRFSKSDFLEFNIEQSLISLDGFWPDKVVNGQTFEWRFKIKNNSENITYEKITIKPDQMGGLVFIDNEPMEIINFTPGEELEFIRKVKITDEREKVELKAIVEWDNQQVKLVQSKQEKEVEILQPKFNFYHYIIGEQKNINPGDWVDIQIVYNNEGNYSIEDMNLSLVLDGAYWDLRNIEKENGQIDGRNLVWTKDDISRFQLLQPGEKGEINLKVKTKSYVSGSQEISISSMMTAKYKLENNQVVIEKDLITNRLNSNLSVRAYPMYYTNAGDQLGRGPIPPQVGEETKYWIFARIINDINDVNDVKVTATLPFNVSWNNRSNVPIGDPIVYNTSDRSISWAISKVPKQADNFGFAFEVGIIPTGSQKGQYPLLLQDIKVTGKDASTGAAITKYLGNISTKLTEDKRGSYRDDVVK